MFNRLFGWLGYVPQTQADAQVEELRAEVATVQKAVEDFARLGVPPQRGRQEAVRRRFDVHEHVRNFKGSVYIAVAAIARRCAMSPPEIYYRVNNKTDALEPADSSDEVVKLFESVNEQHTIFDLIYYTVCWRLVAGDSYTLKVRNSFNKPVELWPIPSQWVNAVPSVERWVDSWEVRGYPGARPERIPVEDVIHIQEPGIDWTGSNRWYGGSPMIAADIMIDLERSMFRQLYARFRNFAPPSMVFESDKEIMPAGYNEEQMREIYDWMAAQHAIAEDSGIPMVTPPGVKLGKMPPGITEMGYLDSLDTALDFILATFATPKAAVGLSKEYNRANYAGAVKAWNDNMISPLLTHTGQHYTQALRHDFGERLVVKFPALDTRDLELMQKWLIEGLKSGAVEIDEVRAAMTDLGVMSLEPLDDDTGQVRIVPAATALVDREGNVTPVNSPNDQAKQGEGGGGEQSSEPPETETESDAQKRVRKAVKSFLDSVEPIDDGPRWETVQDPTPRHTNGNGKH